MPDTGTLKVDCTKPKSNWFIIGYPLVVMVFPLFAFFATKNSLEDREKEVQRLLEENNILEKEYKNYQSAWNEVAADNRRYAAHIETYKKLESSIGINLDESITADVKTELVEYESELDACRRLSSANNWLVEVVLTDGSRCDLVSPDYAIEVDWAKSKWKEAIGQAVYYSLWLEKKPAVLLLTKDEVDEKADLLRCKMTCEKLGIKMFVYKAYTNKEIEAGQDESL